MTTFTSNPSGHTTGWLKRELLVLLKNNRLKSLVLIFCFLLPLAGFSQTVKMDKGGLSPASMQFEESNQPTVSTFFDEYRQDYPMSEDNRMQALRVATDDLGKHHRYNQYYKGIEIIGAQYVLHEKNGSVWYANGHLVHGLDLNVTPGLNENAALSYALQEINAETYMWDKQENEAFLKREQNDANATFYPNGALKLTSGKEELLSKNIRLIYRFDIYAEQPLGRYYVDVDANTGEIVNKLSRIHDADVLGSGVSEYNGTVTMTVDDNTTNFRLRENTTRGATIHTFDMQNGTNYGAAVDITSTTADGPWDAVGVSAHWGAEATYDYYLNDHGRNSLDDAGFGLLSYVHRGVNYNNAFWDGSRMTYGDGDGVNFTPLVGLDVVSHELTHGVTEFTSNLIYYGESGALNESFSDIFGNLVEFDIEGNPGTGTGDWRMGEDITPSGLGIRNMENPNEFSDPDTYYGSFWASTSGGDNGGVHTNSGVQNFWFYLLATGGSGTNDNGDPYSVTGIGFLDAAAIAYHNNASFLISSSNYYDARDGAIAYAEAAFGAGSQQALSTADAWDAVGVYELILADNDDCADAISVACNSAISGSTIMSTLDGAPFCETSVTAPGVWYSVTGNGGDITISTCSPLTNYDSKLSVYTDGCETLTCVGGNDDDFSCLNGIFHSLVTFTSNPGQEYLILVHGFGSSVGNFELTVTCEIPAEISVTPEEFTFMVPLEGSDSDAMTISNTGAAGAVNLDWFIVKGEVTMTATSGQGLSSIPPSEIEVNQTFVINDQSLNMIRSANIPSGVLSKLESMINEPASDKERFAAMLEQLIGEKNYSSFQYSIMENAMQLHGPKAEVAEVDKKEIYDEKVHGVQAGSRQVMATSGGPDAYGYQYIDSDDPNGPSFNWNDITGTGIQLILGDDQGVLLPLPFSFSFYGNEKTEVAVSSNGYLTFGADWSDFSNDPIPHSNDPDDHISPFWDDLNPAAGGTIHYHSDPTQFIVQYTGVPRFGGAVTSYTFQVILNADGSILYQYLDMETSPLNSATVGIENADASVGLQVAYNEAYIHDNLAVLIALPCPWLSASPSAGSTPQGNSENVSVDVDAAGLPIDIYYCNLLINSNAVNMSQVVVPVTMIVGTPLERIDDLIAKVEALEDAGVLNKGQANALIKKLENAKKSINKGNNNAAINQLNAIINQVNAFMNGGILTEEEGNELITCAQIIIDLLEMDPGYKSGETGSGSIDEIAGVYELEQNYPNPFNGTTTISFTLAETNVTTLKVYNSMGQEVATLFNEEALADQRYDVKFNGNHLAEGVYFYRLQSGESVNTMKKMMVIK